MTASLPNGVLTAFVLFCRVGACLMLMPGVSSARIPARIRLFVAFALALGLTPLLFGEVEPRVAGASPATLIAIILAESATGALIGFLGRVFFAALDMAGATIAMAIGLTSPLTPLTEQAEQNPAVVSLISSAALALFFLADLHWEVLRGLVASYVAWPVSGRFDPRAGLVEIVDTLGQAFLLSLRVASPFIVYTLTVNLAIGLAARFAPQIPIYFVTVPAVAAGGLFLLYLTCGKALELFTKGFAGWLATG
ncbi:flagellar biosynthetic protein FliR [Methylocella sp.]|uniref:flagellar biosynthetic protein FliR n=1 Tax=Methylocella sp. TaxID=1978226 RepID=UPI0037836E12